MGCPRCVGAPTTPPRSTSTTSSSGTHSTPRASGRWRHGSPPGCAQQRDAADARGQTLKVFHWSHPERSKLKSILGLAEVGDLIDPETGVFVDLEQVFKANFVSLHGSSIKKVAPHFGFTWRVDDPGGAISQTYLSKVHTSTDPDEVATAKEWLLTYNEDDNAAMAKIRDGMRTKANVT